MTMFALPVLLGTETGINPKDMFRIEYAAGLLCVFVKKPDSDMEIMRYLVDADNLFNMVPFKAEETPDSDLDMLIYSLNNLGIDPHLIAERIGVEWSRVKDLLEFKHW